MIRRGRRLEESISFEAEEIGNSPEFVANYFKKLKKGQKIDEYRSYPVTPDFTGIGVYTKDGGVLFTVKHKYASDLKSFIRSIRRGRYKLSDVSLSGKTITLKREHE